MRDPVFVREKLRLEASSKVVLTGSGSFGLYSKRSGSARAKKMGSFRL